jgi:hypothetical protein
VPNRTDQHRHNEPSGWCSRDAHQRCVGDYAGAVCGCSCHAPVPACPSWCTQPAGHPFAEIDWESGTVTRVHERAFGDRVCVAAIEHAVTEDGPAWLIEAPRVHLYVDGDLDAEGARRLARDLLAAATLVSAL